MTPDAGGAEAQLIAAAVREAWSAADYEPVRPPPTGHRPRVRPVPLKQVLFAFDVVRNEIPRLTRATAAAHPDLSDLRLARPEMVADHTPLAGLLFVTPRTACVLVRRDDPVPRRRFSAAHELGHLLMHFRPGWLSGGDAAVDVVTDDGPAQIWEDEQDEGGGGAELAIRERQANRFAAELLMPEPVIVGLHAFYAERYGTTPRFIEGHIAGDLVVSRAAVRRRLAGLGLCVGA